MSNLDDIPDWDDIEDAAKEADILEKEDPIRENLFSDKLSVFELFQDQR